MKLKIQKGKFIRNIIIGVIALIIVAFIINTAPGYKRNKFQNVINLVIGDENVTEKLQKPIYLDENGVVYISKEDIQQLLDKTFYYDAEEKLLIATSEVTVASMKLNEKEIKIDGSVFDTLYQAIEADNTVYVPIKKVETVYNIETSYLETEKIVIIVAGYNIVTIVAARKQNRPLQRKFSEIGGGKHAKKHTTSAPPGVAAAAHRRRGAGRRCRRAAFADRLCPDQLYHHGRRPRHRPPLLQLRSL